MSNIGRTQRGFEKVVAFFGCELTEEAKKELETFVKKELSSELILNSDVCILWHRNKDFVEFCKKHGIDFEQKEIIICSRYIKATHDFRQYPKLIYEGPIF